LGLPKFNPKDLRTIMNNEIVQIGEDKSPYEHVGAFLPMEKSRKLLRPIKIKNIQTNHTSPGRDTYE